MELRHLAAFRTLATTLNFTQTAALLGLVSVALLMATSTWLFPIAKVHASTTDHLVWGTPIRQTPPINRSYQER